MCEVTGYNATDVRGAHAQGLLPNHTVDLALSRLYEGLARAGYFDAPGSSPWARLGWADVNTPAAQALALRSAADGLVLKKNDAGLLPLALPANRTTVVALVGHWAAATRHMLGGYSGTPPYFHHPAAAAAALNLTVRTAGGPVAQNLSRVNDTWTAPALEAAAAADVVVYCGGLDMSQEGEDRDRTSLAWPAAQLALVRSLAALGKPLVVAQLGGQLDDSPLLADNRIGAVVWAGYPGQDGGGALLDVLTGRTPPAGRLPVTQYPASYADALPLTSMALRPGPGGRPGRTYRWYDGSAVLPFGHGLHYTTFAARVDAAAANPSYAIADLARGCGAAHPDLCPFPAPGVTVRNTGGRASDFVLLAFLAGRYGPAPHPRKTLAAYRRLRGVKPGETAAARLEMTLGALARTDEAGNLVLYPGTYELLLDEPTQDRITFELTGEELVLDRFPQPRTANGTTTG